MVKETKPDNAAKVEADLSRLQKQNKWVWKNENKKKEVGERTATVTKKMLIKITQ